MEKIASGCESNTRFSMPSIREEMSLWIHMASDHHLVTAGFKLKLMKSVPKKQQENFATGKLSEERFQTGAEKQIP